MRNSERLRRIDRRLAAIARNLQALTECHGRLKQAVVEMAAAMADLDIAREPKPKPRRRA